MQSIAEPGAMRPKKKEDCQTQNNAPQVPTRQQAGQSMTLKRKRVESSPSGPVKQPVCRALDIHQRHQLLGRQDQRRLSRSMPLGFPAFVPVPGGPNPYIAAILHRQLPLNQYPYPPSHPSPLAAPDIPLVHGNLATSSTKAKPPMVVVPHLDDMDDVKSGGVMQQLAAWLCSFSVVQETYHLCSVMEVLDNKAGAGLLSRELYLKHSDALHRPLIHTTDPGIDRDLFIVLASSWTERPGDWCRPPIDCTRMPLDRLGFPSNKFHLVFTMGAVDFFNGPYAEANVREVMRVLRPGGVAIFGHVWSIGLDLSDAPTLSAAPMSRPAAQKAASANLLRHTGFEVDQLAQHILGIIGEERPGVGYAHRAFTKERNVHLRANSQYSLHTLIYQRITSLWQPPDEDGRRMLVDALWVLLSNSGVTDPDGQPGFGLPLRACAVFITKEPKLEPTWMGDPPLPMFQD